MFALALKLISQVPSSQDRNVRLYDWDGKVLKPAGILEGNTGIISALAFSPDGKLIASGDVSMTFRL